MSAWTFISEAENVLAEYLEPLVPDNVLARPALTTAVIQTPCVSVRHTSVRPFTAASAIVTHVETLTAVTIRSAYDEDQTDAGRYNHTELVAAVMDAVMRYDSATKENALPALLNAVAGNRVLFSMAAWNSTAGGIDAEERHFVTRIDLDTIISPAATGEE